MEELDTLGSKANEFELTLDSPIQNIRLRISKALPAAARIQECMRGRILPPRVSLPLVRTSHCLQLSNSRGAWSI